MEKQIGKQSVRFENPPYIMSSAAIVGQKEGEGPYGKFFDEILHDDKAGCECWEEAEGKLQEMAANKALSKSGLEKKDIRYIIAGDLLGQLMASSFGLMKLEIPMFGIYGACSTMGESISIAFGLQKIQRSFLPEQSLRPHSLLQTRRTETILSYQTPLYFLSPRTT